MRIYAKISNVGQSTQKHSLILNNEMCLELSVLTEKSPLTQKEQEKVFAFLLISPKQETTPMSYIKLRAVARSHYYYGTESHENYRN